jgi:hypothetical protein
LTLNLAFGHQTFDENWYLRLIEPVGIVLANPSSMTNSSIVTRSWGRKDHHGKITCFNGMLKKMIKQGEAEYLNMLYMHFKE